MTATSPGASARSTSCICGDAGQLAGRVRHAAQCTGGLGFPLAASLLTAAAAGMDAMRYGVGEQVKDPSGNLQRDITRVYGALNRLQQLTGAGN